MTCEKTMSRLEEEDSTSERIRVAVIGAGYNGLCALRHFLPDEKYRVTAFEQGQNVGGIWNYPEGSDKEVKDAAASPFCWHLYQNLRTNLPRDLMALEGFAFPKGDPSYCDIATVRQYLQDYAQHFNLLPQIKLQHRISCVVPHFSGNLQKLGPSWKVKVEDLKNQQIFEKIFDVVLLCSGKYQTPHQPELPGLSNFKGLVLHSSQYRIPEIFSDQTVLLVGGGPSAFDITVDLAPFTKKILLSHHKPSSIFKGEIANVFEVPDIANYAEDSAILPDGSSEHVDAVILCTGYIFNFPFLSEECKVETSRGRVKPFYRHLIHCQYPTMAFRDGNIVMTHLLDTQVKYYKAVLDGKVKLPTTEEMFRQTENDFEERVRNGMTDNAHRLVGDKMWDYIDQMAEEAGFQTYEPVVKKMARILLDGMVNAKATYKNFKLERIDSENFIYQPY